MNKIVKYVLIPLSVIALGTALAYGLSRRRKTISYEPNTESNDLLPQTGMPVPEAVSEYNDCQFPLKMGSKNRCVKLIQQALIDNFGNDVLPKYGADGQWGNETENAMFLYTRSNQIDSGQDLKQFLITHYE